MIEFCLFWSICLGLVRFIISLLVIRFIVNEELITKVIMFEQVRRQVRSYLTLFFDHFLTVKIEFFLFRYLFFVIFH